MARITSFPGGLGGGRRLAFMAGQPLFDGQGKPAAPGAITATVRDVFTNQAGVDALAGVWGDSAVSGMQMEPRQSTSRSPFSATRSRTRRPPKGWKP